MTGGYNRQQKVKNDTDEECTSEDSLLWRFFVRKLSTTITLLLLWNLLDLHPFALSHDMIT